MKEVKPPRSLFSLAPPQGHGKILRQPRFYPLVEDCAAKAIAVGFLPSPLQGIGENQLSVAFAAKSPIKYILPKQHWTATITPAYSIAAMLFQPEGGR
jgi:hypothetical protein